MLTNFEKFYRKICLWKKFKILSYPKSEEKFENQKNNLIFEILVSKIINNDEQI